MLRNFPKWGRLKGIIHIRVIVFHIDMQYDT